MSNQNISVADKAAEPEIHDDFTGSQPLVVDDYLSNTQSAERENLARSFFSASPNSTVYEGRHSDFRKFLQLLNAGNQSTPIHVVMGLGASEMSVSPRIYCVLDHFARTAEFVIKNGIENVSCEIFIASALGTEINQLDTDKVNRTTLQILEFVSEYISTFHPLVKPYFRAYTDNHPAFRTLLTSEIAEVAEELPTTDSIVRMSKGRSTIEMAKRYAASHAIQLRACEPDHDNPEPFVIIPGGASEKNFVEHISTASKIFSERHGYRCNSRLHCLTENCTLPPYFPGESEPKLGEKIYQNTFEFEIWNSKKVRKDYRWLDAHPMKLYLIEHFNNYSEDQP